MKALKNSPLPTAALIGSVGASAAYVAATGANVIIASDYAEVGSIGVTQSYVQQATQDQKNGLEFIPLATGPFKDMGNPDNPITPAQRALYARDNAIFLNIMVGQIAQNRGMATDTVLALADGSAMPASLALKHGLIDIVGDIDTAQKFFEQRTGGKVVFCNAN